MPLSVSVSGSPVSLDLQPVVADAYGRVPVITALTAGGTPVDGTVTGTAAPVANGSVVRVMLTSKVEVGGYSRRH